MTPGKLPRREREKLRQRGEILHAALALFSEKGFHNVSVQEIAAKAEFAVGTLYKFFQNKEELYKALVLEQCDRFEEALTGALEVPGDPAEKLRAYVRTKSEMVRRNLAFVRLLLAETKGASFNIKAGLDEEVRARYRQFLRKLAAVFETGIRSGRFRPIADPHHLALALDGTMDAFFLLWLEAPETYPFPEDPDTLLNIFFQGLLNP